MTPSLCTHMFQIAATLYIQGFHLEGGGGGKLPPPPPPPPKKKGKREEKRETDRQTDRGRKEGGQCIFGYYDDYCSYINRILAEQSNQL